VTDGASRSGVNPWKAEAMSDDSIQLRDQVGVLRRRWRTVAVTVLLAVAAGLLLPLLQTPIYVAETRVLLAPVIEGETLTSEQVATEATSVTLSADAAIDELGLDETRDELLEDVTVTPDSDGAAVLTISVSREDPDEAAQIANSMAAAYTSADGDETRDQVELLDKRIARLDQEIGVLATQASQAPTETRRIAVLSQRRRLRAERTLLVDARAAALAGPDIQSEQAEVVTPAVAPSSPSSPQPIRTAALAGLIGLLLGVGLAYLREYFDDSIGSEQKIRDNVPDRPVLGHVPRWERSVRAPVTVAAPTAAASESYRELGANVRHLLGAHHPDDGVQQPGRVVLVASASSGEGKTVTAVNLAIVEATARMRVVLVDANLRRPRLHELLGVTPELGLVDVLDGTCTSAEALVEVPGTPGLLLLAAGAVRDDTAGLLTSPRLRRLLADLRREADLVVVDSAAVLRVADALELAPGSDLTVLVARRKVSRGRDIVEAVQRIERVGGSIAGVVLNDVAVRRDSKAYHA